MKLRNVRVEEDIAYITLTKGYVAIIDAINAQLVSNYNWYAVVKENTVYAITSVYTDGKAKRFRLHRKLLGYDGFMQVDHINGNGLDNRLENLRLATNQQNQFNRRICKKNTSGFKGVTWSKKNLKWRARIKINGKNTHIGFFDDPSDASKAYHAASVKFHGEFGRSS